MIHYWKTFEGKPYGTKRGEIRVTLSPRKVFLLNQAAYQALGSPRAIEFKFDENHKRIGIKPTDPRKENAFEVKRKKNTNYRVIMAGAFCNHVGIRLEKTVVFNEAPIEKDGTMVLALEKAINVARGAR
jgi:hypothetical protein